MANEIKELFSSSAALTITIASLASSTTGVGRQSTIVDNSTTRYQKILLYCLCTMGTTPTANRTVRYYLIRGDNSTYRSDNAGASDAAFTVKMSQPIGSLYIDVATSNLGYYGDFVIENPGPTWGVAIVHDAVAALNSTAGNHYIRWVGVNPEVQ